ALLSLDPALDADRALVVVVVEDLAVQAGDALVGIDVSLGMDRLDRAIVEAAHAGIPALPVALEPVEHPQPARDREGGAERTEIAAEESLHEEPGSDEHQGEQHEPPLTHEPQDDRRLERLDLREHLGIRQGAQGNAEEAEEDDVLDWPHALMHAPRNLDLRQLQCLCRLVAELLQRAEGAEPAAEGSPSPEKQAGGDRAPEHEDQRVDQE